MGIENQVVSLELAKRLKELGVNQDSQFYYCNAKSIDDYKLTNEVRFIAHISQTTGLSSDWFSAFTAAEILKILPNTVTTPHGEPFNGFRIQITKFLSVENDIIINNFIVNYVCDTQDITGKNPWMERLLTNNIYDPNLANALAKMLIYLIENKLISI